MLIRDIWREIKTIIVSLIIVMTVTLRREVFAWIYFRESFFETFRVDLVMQIGTGGFFPRINFTNLSVINIWYILIFFSWFFLQLVVCESRSAYLNCLIFQIALFWYKRLNSWLNVYEEIRRSRYNKKLHFSFFLFLTFFFALPLLYCLISSKIYLTWPSLIDRKPNVKM